MNRQTLLRSASVLSICLAGFAACADDDGDGRSLDTGLGQLGPGAAGAGMGDTDTTTAAAPSADMGFFVTSEGSTTGANLGGLTGADQRCQDLADAAGAGDKTWHAYLSVDDDGTGAAVNAMDRIGSGPWMNFNGDVIAMDMADLLDAANIFNGDPNMILDEKGQNAPGMEHDILTGTKADGTVAPGLNCENWTSDSADLTDNPQVGHSDIPIPMFSPLWDEAHTSQDCSQPGLVAFGGAGRLYCFAL